MKENKRDNFTPAVKTKLAKRVAFICSNPSCQKLTIGPNTKKGMNNIGVAAHICAAAPGGPRYDETMTEEERKSIDNGIWLCQSCAKLIDSDEIKYTVELIKKWKEKMESTISFNFGKRINLKKKNKLEYIFETLKDTNNWEKLQEGNMEGYYFKENPSYMIEIIPDNNNNTEFYSYLMRNKSTSFSTLFLRYNGTCIYTCKLVSLDSGRLTTVVPLSEYINYEGDVYKYKYFIKKCKEIILRDFLYDFDKDNRNSEEVYAMKQLNEIVVEFESEKEKEDFEQKYLKNIKKDEVKVFCKGYENAGITERESKINMKTIGLGKYIKSKYSLYKKNLRK